jgi:prepilin-type N-terminal cleavage/methylation domain-containing protein/prepilin-type processing-associated H-X9-DG protein
MSNKMSRKAFTLVELLVVIAVISLLLSIMLPCVGRVREECRSVICQNKLRQMVMAANVYTCDNDGFYPLAGFMDFGELSEQREWDFFSTFEAGVLKESGPGYLWRGGGEPEIQQCPSYRGSSNTAGDPFTGYNYNASYIGGFVFLVFGTVGGNVSSKIDEIVRSTDCAIFGDGQFVLGANKYMRSPRAGKLDKDFSGADRYAGTQGYRHLGRTNAAYCDGRVASVSERFSETKSRVIIDEYNEQNAVKVGFLSVDNSAYDLK